eukprot:4010994-Amphidinium_carterae.1
MVMLSGPCPVSQGAWHMKPLDHLELSCKLLLSRNSSCDKATRLWRAAERYQERASAAYSIPAFGTSCRKPFNFTRIWAPRQARKPHEWLTGWCCACAKMTTESGESGASADATQLQDRSKKQEVAGEQEEEEVEIEWQPDAPQPAIVTMVVAEGAELEVGKQ